MDSTANKKNKENNKDLNNNNKKNLSIIHYMENPFCKRKIDSPRSLLAMNNLKYTMKDIYFLTFKEFSEKYKQFSEDLQRKKYEFYEQYRQLKIKNINLERDRLIQNLKDGNNTKENIEIKNMIKKLKETEAELEKKILMNNKETNSNKNNDIKKINYDREEKNEERKKRREEIQNERKKEKKYKMRERKN